MTRQILKNKEFGATEAERNKLLKEGGLRIVTTMDVKANTAAMNAARETIPPDDPSGFEVAIASIKPGTGEVLGFGLNRIYDATDRAQTDSTRTAVNYAVDEADGGGWGFQVGSTWKPDQPGRLDAERQADQPGIEDFHVLQHRQLQLQRLWIRRNMVRAELWWRHGGE